MATPASDINGILAAKYLNPNRTIFTFHFISFIQLITITTLLKYKLLQIKELTKKDKNPRKSEKTKV